ncbi:MAG TPA: S24 family peptidase [Bacillota bacterium]|nr:S24 family peptidase [Bacillota bacterium]
MLNSDQLSGGISDPLAGALLWHGLAPVALRSGRGRPSVRLPAIPVLGSIPAGLPEEGSQDPDESERIDLQRLLPETAPRIFPLRVAVDTLRNAGLFKGDLVFIEHAKLPKPGDIIAVYLDGKTRFGTYLSLRGKRYMQPLNAPEGTPICCEGLMILGVMLCLYRQMKDRF